MYGGRGPGPNGGLTGGGIGGLNGGLLGFPGFPISSLNTKILIKSFKTQFVQVLTSFLLLFILLTF